MCSPMGLLSWFKRFDEHVEGEVDGGRSSMKSRAAAQGSSKGMLLRLWAAWLHTNKQGISLDGQRSAQAS
jgi:hypothetical protein